MKLTEKIIEEVANEITESNFYSIGIEWIKQKYKVNRETACGLLKRAKASFRRERHNKQWESSTSVPEHHRFTTANLYSDFEEVETVGNYKRK